MDSTLLSSLLIKARKQKDDVVILVNGDFKKIIHSWDNFEFRNNSLVLRDSIISLDAINVAKIIPVHKIMKNEEVYTSSNKSMRKV